MDAEWLEDAPVLVAVLDECLVCRRASRGARSTLVTSQLPVSKWHEHIAGPTLADAILDRLVHNAYKLNLEGDSMRKKRRPLTQADHSQA